MLAAQVHKHTFCYSSSTSCCFSEALRPQAKIGCHVWDSLQHGFDVQPHPAIIKVAKSQRPWANCCMSMSHIRIIPVLPKARGQPGNNSICKARMRNNLCTEEGLLCLCDVCGKHPVRSFRDPKVSKTVHKLNHIQAECSTEVTLLYAKVVSTSSTHCTELSNIWMLSHSPGTALDPSSALSVSNNMLNSHSSITRSTHTQCGM